MGNKRLKADPHLERAILQMEKAEWFKPYHKPQIIRDKTQVYAKYACPMKEIGIINPYALVRSYRGKKEPLAVVSDELLVTTLNKYLGKDTIKTIQDLNAANSVLFRQVNSKDLVVRCASIPMIMAKPATATANLAQQMHINNAHFRNVYAGDDQAGLLTDALPMGVTMADVENIASMGTATHKVNGVDVPCKFRDDLLDNRAGIIGDIVQGACLDCYFLAALFSWAWYCIAFPPKTLVANNGIYTIPFHSYSYPNWSTTDIQVKPTLPLDSQSQLVFAQQTPDKSEIWPALYEKAYAEYKKCIALPAKKNADQGPFPLPYDPDIAQLPRGDPLLALTEITKWLAATGTNNDAGYPTVHSTASIVAKTNPYGSSAYEILEKYNKSGLFTNYPTVAWTYGENSAPFPNTWVINTILQPNHSYSILGRFVNAAGQYIVVRNPWGLPVDKTDVRVTQNGFQGYIPSVVWQPDSVINARFRLNLGKNNFGIFGIHTTAFEKYFAGFGWVQFDEVKPDNV